MILLKTAQKDLRGKWSVIDCSSWLQSASLVIVICHVSRTSSWMRQAECMSPWDVVSVCYFVVHWSCSSSMFTLTIRILLRRHRSTVVLRTDLLIYLPIHWDWYLMSISTSTCMSLQLHSFSCVVLFFTDSFYCHSRSEGVQHCVKHAVINAAIQ